MSRDSQKSKTPEYTYNKMYIAIKDASKDNRFTPIQGNNKYRHVSTDFPIIEIQNNNDLLVKKSSEVGRGGQSGMDENFMTSKQKLWKDQDKTRSAEEFGFDKAFHKSRVRSNEIVHVNPKTKETTGHMGALYDSNEVKPGGGGARTIGSQGKNSFHDKRQKAIEVVIADNAITAKDKPVKAVIAATQSVIKILLNIMIKIMQILFLRVSPLLDWIYQKIMKEN